jgi:hypothetical protein
VRVPKKLRAVGIATVDDICARSGDELLQNLSPNEFVKLAVAIRSEGRTFAPTRTAVARFVAEDRDLDFLRLRLIEGLSLKDCAARHGVTTDIARRRLRMCFGITGRAPRGKLGHRVRQAREASGLTVDGLAAAVNAEPDDLRSLEAGWLDPDYVLLVRLAEALGVRPGALVSADDR